MVVCNGKDRIECSYFSSAACCVNVTELIKLMPQSQYEKHLFQHLPLPIAMCSPAVDCGMVTLKAFHFTFKKKNEITLSNCILLTKFSFVLSCLQTVSAFRPSQTFTVIKLSQGWDLSAVL